MNGTKRHHLKHSNGPRRTAPRGLAMLLVLISLASATILSLAYLSSRDNSAVIGANVADAAAARWAAASGIDLTIAVLETNTAWRTLHVDGRLITGHTIAGASVDVDLIDLETDSPPTEDSRYIRIIVTATADGVQQTALANVEVEPGAKNKVAVDLSEFAIFAAQKIELKNNATLTRWPMAPTAPLGQPLAVGSQAVAASTVDILNDAIMLDTTVFHSEGASGSFRSGSNNRTKSVGGTIHMPNPPTPWDTDGGVFEGLAVLSNASETVTVANRRIEGSTAQNNARLTFRGDITRTIRDDMQILSNAKVIIDGHARFLIFGDLILDNGSIELTPDSTLEMFVGGDITVTDSYIGEQRANNDYTRNVSGNAPYMNTNRVRIWGLSDGDTPTWRLQYQSVVKGNMYSTNAEMRIRNNSALYGRATAKAVLLENTATLFYDPGLDTRTGYTSPSSPLFDAEGNIKGEIATLLGSLSPNELANLAASLGLQVRLGRLRFGSPDETTDDTPVGQPTPRSVPCTVYLVVWGADVMMVEAGAKR